MTEKTWIEVSPFISRNFLFLQDDDDVDDDDDDIDGQSGEEGDEEGAEEEPLGSGDDISDGDPSDLFNTENVVVCQYDKITRTKNKWKFNLKDGIMNLNGKDYVFQKATGEAEWWMLKKREINVLYCIFRA